MDPSSTFTTVHHSPGIQLILGLGVLAVFGVVLAFFLKKPPAIVRWVMVPVVVVHAVGTIGYRHTIDFDIPRKRAVERMGWLGLRITTEHDLGSYHSIEVATLRQDALEGPSSRDGHTRPGPATTSYPVRLVRDDDSFTVFRAAHRDDAAEAAAHYSDLLDLPITTPWVLELLEHAAAGGGATDPGDG